MDVGSTVNPFLHFVPSSGLATSREISNTLNASPGTIYVDSQNVKKEDFMLQFAKFDLSTIVTLPTFGIADNLGFKEFGSTIDKNSHSSLLCLEQKCLKKLDTVGFRESTNLFICEGDSLKKNDLLSSNILPVSLPQSQLNLKLANSLLNCPLGPSNLLSLSPSWTLPDAEGLIHADRLANDELPCPIYADSFKDSSAQYACDDSIDLTESALVLPGVHEATEAFLNDYCEFKDLVHVEGNDKLTLLNVLSASLIGGPNYKNSTDASRIALMQAANVVASRDPEFLAKAALYTRCDLNVRTPANFLLAICAHWLPCRPYLRKYFTASIRLPTDWIEVGDLYSSLASQRTSKGRTPLPAALRRVMEEKFLDFDEYQLAKHNKNKKSNKKLKQIAKRKERVRAKKGRKNNDDADNEEEGKAEPDLAATGKSGLTLKKLVRQLHIKRPAGFVMAIVGKRYPSNSNDFYKCGLPGVWDESRAGKRMKLATPETWETQIASMGNKAEIWESLIDKKKLPFMAMLRNIRNLIRAGISEAHHENILKRLQDEKSVINSRQFPFRFFSAFQVLDSLREELKKKVTEAANAVCTQPVRPRRGQKRAKQNWKDKRTKQKNTLKGASYDEPLLNRYQKALDTSVKIATLNNVSPIRGRTLVIVDVSSQTQIPCSSAKGLGKPRTVCEVALLLALMCESCCEDGEIYLSCNNGLVELKKTVGDHKGQILHRLTNILQDEVPTVNDRCTEKLESLLLQMIKSRTRIDNILILGCGSIMEGTKLDALLRQFRLLVNGDMLYVSVNLSAPRTDCSASTMPHDRNVQLSGYSDQILRFIAERGSGSQLQYVENISLAHKLKDVKTMKTSRSDVIVPHEIRTALSGVLLHAVRATEPRKVKVFVSSTFRDMHAERDLLARFVFPELRRRAARELDIDLSYIDLRWGLTAEQDGSSNCELCLRQVLQCQLFVGLLGERYGYRPHSYWPSSKPLPEDLRWLETYPVGASMTELEIQCFLHAQGEDSAERASFYIRDSDFAKKIPEMYRSDFLSESPEAKMRIDLLKETVRSSVHPLYDGYPCNWGGTRAGKPIVGGLNELAKHLFMNLWNGLLSLSQTETVTAIVDNSNLSPITMQWMKLAVEVDRFRGREKHLKHCLSIVRNLDTGVLFVDAHVGEGKTAFLAKVAVSCVEAKLGAIIPCFANYLPEEAHCSSGLLRLLTQAISSWSTESCNERIPETYADFAEFLRSAVKRVNKIVLLMDGWAIPTISHLFDLKMTGLVIVTTTNPGKIDAKVVAFQLGNLGISERACIVRDVLLAHGKTLDESPFNNQMRILLSKKGCESPHYIRLACDCLRLFGDFDKLTGYIRLLPSTLELLARFAIARLESDFGAVLVRSACSVLLACGNSGLTEHWWYELTTHAVRLTGSKNSTMGGINMVEFVTKRVAPPMSYAQFIAFFNVVQPILHSYRVDGGPDLWRLATNQVAALLRKRYLGTRHDTETSLLKLVVAYFECQCDPAEDGTYLSPSRLCFSKLMEYSVLLGQWDRLATLFLNPAFQYSICRLHLIPDILRLFSSCIGGLRLFNSSQQSRRRLQHAATVAETETNLCVVERFLASNAPFLTKYPNLYPQCLVNDMFDEAVKAFDSGPELWSRHLPSVFYSDINHQQTQPAWLQHRTIDAPQNLWYTCVTTSSDSQYVAVGLSSGLVRVLEYASGQVVREFHEHAQAVRGMTFLGARGRYLCSASEEGTVIVWDVHVGTKTAALSAHNGVVSACAEFPHERQGGVITVGWDGYVYLWNFLTGRYVEHWNTGSSINAAAVHPTERALVTGHWDATLKVYAGNPLKRRAVLRGHNCAVRCVRYSPKGDFIASVAMSSEVKLWSAAFGAQLGSFEGHTMPTTSLAYSADGCSLYTASEDGTVKVWAGVLGKPLRVLEHATLEGGSAKCTAVAQSPDGMYVAIGYDSGIVLICDPIGNVKHRLTMLNDTIVKLDFAANSTLLLVASTHTALLFVYGDIEANIVLDCDEISNITFACCSNDNIVVTHMNGATCIYEAVDVAFMKKSAKKGKKSLRRLACLHAHDGPVTSAAFGSDRRLATVGFDKNLYVWNLDAAIGCADGQEPTPMHAVPNAHPDVITTVAWSTSLAKLVTGSNDCSVKVWDTNTWTILRQLNGHEAPIVALDMKRGCIASASLDGTVVIWSYRGIKLTQLKRLCAHYDAKRTTPTAVSLLLDVVVSSNTSMNWADEVERADGSATASNDSGHNNVNAIVAIAFDDGACEVWQPFRGWERECLCAHDGSVLALTSAVAGTGTDSVISVGRDGYAKWWIRAPKDFSSDRELESGREHHAIRVTAMCAVMFLRETIVISADLSGIAICWHEDGRTRCRTTLHENCVTSLAALHVEGQFISSSEDYHLSMWTFAADQDCPVLLTRLSMNWPISRAIFTVSTMSVTLELWSGEVCQVAIVGSTMSLIERMSAISTDNIVMSCAKVVPALSEGLSFTVCGTMQGSLMLYADESRELCTSWQAHSRCVTDFSARYDASNQCLHIVTCSLDNFVKLWFVDYANNWLVKLAACWQSRVALTAVVAVGESDVWYADLLGHVRRLQLLAPNTLMDKVLSSAL